MEQARAIAEIEKSGGRVTVDEKESRQAGYCGAGLVGSDGTDAGVAHLKGLTQLQLLELGNTKVTDAGLANLKGLTQLQSLDLHGTQITDAGLQI